MNWAAKLGYIDHSPIAHMEKPRPGKREVVISDEQFSELMSFVRDPGFADLIRVTWETGCRPQESLLVEARHVELENSRWVIPEGESKTHIVRVVYLTDEALAITKRQMLRFATGPLFRNAHGNPWNKYSVKNSFDRLRIRMVTQEMHAAGLELKESEITHAISKPYFFMALSRFWLNSSAKMAVFGAGEMRGSVYAPSGRPKRAKMRRCRSVGAVRRSNSASGCEDQQTRFLHSVARFRRRH
jgi:hypothetical protein